STNSSVFLLADPCQNQGVWTATGCSCQAYLEGDYCQFSSPTIDITPEVGSFVRMTARVTNRLFSEAMGDSSSTAYHGFADEFERTMDQIYQNVSGYHSTKILDLRNGSVVVNYKVLLHPPSEANSNYSLDHKSQELLETLKSVAQPQNCSHTASRGLGRAEGVLERVARRAAIICRKRVPVKFRPFYHPYVIGKGVFCITNCTLNVPGSINCNGG
ncbi:MUC3B protein, partial [Nothocercus nigrocapillus]|nr:MUC3B protein [Nothocercus nigrocapillus]